MARAAWQGVALWGGGVVVTAALSSAVVLAATAGVTGPVRTVELVGGVDELDGIPLPSASRTADASPAPSASAAPSPAPTDAISPPAPAATSAPAPPATSDDTGSSGGPATDDDPDEPTDDLPSSAPSTPGPSRNASPNAGGAQDDDATGLDEYRTVRTEGGTAKLRFTDDGITVVYATPGQGFTVEVEDEGEDVGEAHVRIEFESDDHRSRIDARISGGEPVVEVKELER